MDGQHDGGRQSSLPSSLIPHLYRHPPLRHYDPDANAPLPPLDAPFVPAPAPLRPPAAPYAFWSEGEAGPSSLARYRRPDSLSPRPFDVFGRSNPNYDYPDPHFALPQHHTQSYASHLPYLPSSDVDPDASFSFRHDPYPSYPSITGLSLHTPPPPPLRSFRSPSSPEGSYCRSESYADLFNSNDEALPPEHREGKRRRPQSAQEVTTPRKNSTPRKTAVACNFCRGRKLRCNGARPTCSHCTARKIKCEYVSTPKRRGPGKAPKGSRSKKAVDALRLDPSAFSANNATDRPSSSVLPTYELAAQAPEMHPYTHVMSLDTLDVFSFQPPAPAPRYLPDPELMRREYYSRARSPRRRQTSSEDWSGAERE